MKNLSVQTEAGHNSFGPDNATKPKLESRAQILGASLWGTDIRRLARWATKGGTAILDQGLFSGTNFLVSMLLARWVEPSAYGAFSTAFSVFLLVTTFHTAFWTEPMMVYGSGRFLDKFPTYYRLLLAGHWRFGVVLFGIFVFVGVLFFSLGQMELGRSFVGLAVSAPLTLYLWLARRGPYVFLEPRLAFLGATFYSLTYPGFVWFLQQLKWLNELSVFVAGGVTSWLVGKLIIAFVFYRIDSTNQMVSATEVRAVHWEYGRWAIVATVLNWVLVDIHFITLAASHGLEASAHLRALYNLILPAIQFNTAIVALLVPTYTRALRSGFIKRVLYFSIAIFSISALVYYVGLRVSETFILIWLYDGKYMADGVIEYLGLFPLLAGLASVLAAAHRAYEKPVHVAKASVIAAGWTLLVGIPLTLSVGLLGSVVAILTSYLVLVVVMTSQLLPYVFGMRRSS